MLVEFDGLVGVWPENRVHRPPMKMRERVDLHPSLKVPFTHPWLFGAFYLLPTVGSMVAGSMIYRFSWTLLFPGFWGFFVCCFIIDALIGGTMTDNRGTATRRGSPIRYWLKVGIWSAAYLFSVMFPVGYALQERGRELQAPPETNLPAPTSPLAVPGR